MPGYSNYRDELAAERLAREKRNRLAKLDLTEFVPAVSPDLEPPTHLAPLVDLFERATKSEVRAVSSVPPQHGKSLTLFHLLVRELLRNPKRRHGYGTYSIDFARSQSLKAAAIAARALVPLERQTLDEWITPQGGGIVWTGVGGQLTGRPIDGVFVADDLLKNRQDAESPTIREAVDGFLTSTVMTRLHPGASLLLNATRWHTDDPSGRRVKGGWPVVNLPAIDDNGEALWPSQRPLDFLNKQRVDMGEYDWWSIYQGEPRPRGGAVFKGVTTYDKIPDGAYKAGVGFDAAYTAKTHADYSVALSGRVVSGTIYLTGMMREQMDAGDFFDLLVARAVKRLTWLRSGTEKGLESFMKRSGIAVDAIPATTDKFVRATPAAAMWNDGKIAVPSESAPEYGPWVSTLLDEVLNFTGLKDPDDDVVDALAALHHALIGTPKPDRTALRRGIGLR